MATAALPFEATLHTSDPSASGFVAPGPGTWQQDPAHFPRPLTPWGAEVMRLGFARGFAASMRRYGILVSHLEPAIVRGYVYYKTVPAIDPAAHRDDAEESFRAAAATAATAFAERRWQKELAWWDGEVRPDSVRRNRGLAAIDVGALRDDELARHLQECRDNQQEMMFRHHRFNAAALLKVGEMVAKVAGWTGVTRSEILYLLRGSTPLSSGIAAPELARVGAALREAALTRDGFPAGLQAHCVLEALRMMPGEVGDSVRAYLDACGLHVASGYDVSDRTTGELPDAVVQAFWQARDGERAAAVVDGSAEERIRDLVPAPHRAEFDQLLGEARLVNRLRDERGVYTDLWAAGISRRAILETGRRLALRGRIDEAELVFEASAEEMVLLLAGEPGPSSAELTARAERRHAVPLALVPASLGDPPQPPPPVDGLPEPLRTAMMAIGTAIEEVLGVPPAASRARELRGQGVSAGVYVGVARVVHGPADFNRLRQGDVLVTPSTNAAFNVVLPLLGAIVTDRGALLSHAAIVAREHGIPAVVATQTATRTVRDGDRVRVDGARGVVEVLR